MAVQGQPALRGVRSGEGERRGQDRVRPEPPLIGRAVEVDQEPVERGLVRKRAPDHRDLDLAGEILGGLDIEAVINRLDLTELVQRRVDLDAIVAGVDIEPVINRLDLTAIVLNHVDLDALVDAVLARIDLVGLAEEVIDAVDLPEIIRESTGSMASETVRGARMQGIHADEAVGRAVDRILLRRGRRHPRGPGGQRDQGKAGTVEQIATEPPGQDHR